MVAPPMQSISGDSDGTYTWYMSPLTVRALGLARRPCLGPQIIILFVSAVAVVVYILEGEKQKKHTRSYVGIKRPTLDLIQYGKNVGEMHRETPSNQCHPKSC
jgi:hypothetical protein